MIVVDTEYVDLATSTGPMRTHIVRPAAPGRYPGILLFSEIFQVTAPIHRTAVQLAGHGYVIAVPEVYHEYEPAGTVLKYDQEGSDRGNVLKTTKPVPAYDDDARVALAYLAEHPDCTGRLGAMGICMGGHLAFRAAMNPNVHGAVCFYATDIHKGGLGEGMKDNSMARAGEIKGELLMVWGRQDPHIPTEGRMKVLERSQWRTRFPARRRRSLRSRSRPIHVRPRARSLPPDDRRRRVTAVLLDILLQPWIFRVR